MKTVCIASGSVCPRATVDISVLFEYFEANGMVATQSLDEADTVVVTLCGFNAISEAASYRLLDAAKRRRKAGSQLIVTGCLAAMHEERLREEYGVTAVPPLRVGMLDDIIGASVKIEAVPDPHDVEHYLALAQGCFDNRQRRGLAAGLIVSSGIPRAMVKLGLRQESELCSAENVYCIRVAYGCRGGCTYCAIRFAYGPLQSKSMESVLAEFDAGLEQGFTDFKLLAQDLGGYGQDAGTNITELLRAILERPGDYRLQLNDLGIRWVSKQLEELVTLFSENASRIEIVRMPLESGSDKVLRAMGRGYSASDAEESFRAVRAALPNALLATHVIAGFPGETEEDVRATARVLRAGRFDRVDVFEYSDRPGTEASKLPDKVRPGVIRSRGRRLRGEFGGRMAGVEYFVQSLLAPHSARRAQRSARAD
jgi:tRNA A37 methylthiotransferase MiaB